jgi:hypothetical protein
MALANEDERSASTPDPRPTVTPAAVRPLRTPMALAAADVADEPPRNGRLLPVKRVGAGTAKVRGSNPLSSTRKSARTTLGSRSPQSLDYLVR